MAKYIWSVVLVLSLNSLEKSPKLETVSRDPQASLQFISIIVSMPPPISITNNKFLGPCLLRLDSI